MKRKLMIVLSLLCILALTVPAFVSAETVKTAVNGGSLRLRKKATTSSATVGFVQDGYFRGTEGVDGDHIDVLSKGSIWSKVETNSGKVGYIKTLYIKGAGSAYASGTTYTARRAGKTTAAVHMRGGATTSSGIIKTLAKGTKVTVLGKNGNFYLVSTSNGTQGFVSKKYISTSGSSSTTPSTSSKYARVTGKVVNMRSGAGTKYKVITALTKGTQVKILNTGNSRWWKVSYTGNGKTYTGYMSTSYLKRK